MVILIDTNVIIDYLIDRMPFADSADKIITMCGNRKLHGFSAAHTFPDLFYILRKDYTAKERREMLLGICKVLSVVGCNKYQLVSALNNENFTDFEDCLQAECALAIGAKYIVTRNVADFSTSPVPAILPEDLLAVTEKAAEGLNGNV